MTIEAITEKRDTIHSIHAMHCTVSCTVCCVLCHSKLRCVQCAVCCSVQCTATCCTIFELYHVLHAVTCPRLGQGFRLIAFLSWSCWCARGLLVNFCACDEVLRNVCEQCASSGSSFVLVGFLFSVGLLISRLYQTLRRCAVAPPCLAVLHGAI